MFDLKSAISFSPVISFSAQRKSEKYLHLLREATCYFQGHFTNYSIVASKIHKNIRLCKDSSSNLSELCTHINSLKDHCNRYVDAAFRKASEFSHKYFEIDDRHRPCKPRICVKAGFDGKIVDVFRDRGPIMPGSFPANQNTGFDSIIKDGKFFICNDIPRAAKKRQYQNCRLDLRMVEDYKIPSRFHKLCSRFSAEPHVDLEWERCWDVGSNKRPLSETCYKATLVIPMTLRFADTTFELRESLELDGTHEKSTFGYLCFDHQKEGFFRESEDMDIGYFFADMLSLYLINRRNYIDSSITFKEASGLIPANPCIPG